MKPYLGSFCTTYLITCFVLMVLALDHSFLLIYIIKENQDESRKRTCLHRLTTIVKAPLSSFEAFRSSASDWHNISRSHK